MGWKSDGRICKVDDCNLVACTKTKGLCKKHSKINKNKKQGITCCVCGSYDAQLHKSGNYYCPKHRAQIKKHGEVTEYTMKSKNIYEVIDEVNKIIKVYTNNRKGKINGFFITDSINLDLVKSHKWSFLNNGYVVSARDGALLYFHKMLFSHDVNETGFIDHINGDKSDNRYINLRPINRMNNRRNSKVRSNNTSGITGVSLRKQNTATWWARIMPEGNVDITLYHGESFDEAVKMRIVGEAIHFKEYSNNYSPLTNTIQLTYLSHDDKLQTFIECDLTGQILQFTKLPN